MSEAEDASAAQMVLTAVVRALETLEVRVDASSTAFERAQVYREGIKEVLSACMPASNKDASILELPAVSPVRRAGRAASLIASGGRLDAATNSAMSESLKQLNEARDTQAATIASQASTIAEQASSLAEQGSALESLRQANSASNVLLKQQTDELHMLRADLSSAKLELAEIGYGASSSYFPWSAALSSLLSLAHRPLLLLPLVRRPRRVWRSLLS